MTQPVREKLAEGREHLTVTGQFQSDKYPWCPPGHFVMSFKDPKARDLLSIYATRREEDDPELARDIREGIETTKE